MWLAGTIVLLLIAEAERINFDAEFLHLSVDNSIIIL